MSCGIYTLANDKVLDQLIALLNSIETNSPGYPVCVIPYDDNTKTLAAVIEQHPDHVTLFDDTAAIARWEAFAAEIWASHPTASEAWRDRGVQGVNRLGMHRRFCAFDGPFERYIYLDADTLVLNQLDAIFSPLDDWDWVVYDFQYKDVTHVFNAESPQLPTLFTAAQLKHIFCAGMYASRRGIFPTEQLSWILEQLKSEAGVLYINGPDQSIVNYMVLKLGLSVYNLSQQLPLDQRTGCCVTSPHFERHFEGETAYLCDRGNRLTYLHYIGLSSNYFTRLCQGENLDFAYRDLFLHYRYLQAPDERPQLTGPLQPLVRRQTRLEKGVNQVKSFFKTPLRS